MAPPRYSVVIPFHNEEGNVRPLLQDVAATFERLGAPWEAVLINDGSTDRTAAELAAAAEGRPAWRVLHHATNLGQARALLTGLHAARGEIIVTLDGDRQNDPRDIPRLLAAMAESGADLVCGWRQQRRDSRTRRFLSRVANAVRRRLLHDGVHDSGCQLRAFRRALVPHLEPMPLLQSFVPALAVQAGFSVTEIPIHHLPRVAGRSNYGLRNLWWRPALGLLALWSRRLRRGRRVRRKSS